METKTVFRSAIVVAAIGLCGCSQFGPEVIEASRTDYNIAMSQTDEEQALLNLVRLRYGDSPYFLEATALNTQFSIAPSVEIGSTFDFNGNNTYNAKGRFAYEEKPTISYTPLSGQEFVTQVLSRISLETLLLLNSSGWRLERVLRLGVEELNGLDNASRASGPTPSEAPDARQFHRAIEILAGLERRQQLLLIQKEQKDATRYIARFSEDAIETSEFTELASLLNLDRSLREFNLTFNQVLDTSDAINFTTRSFMGVMYFLSQTVEVPADDVALGKVTVTRDRSGEPFDWSGVTQGLLSVRSAGGRPNSPAVAVNYRGSWFYIDDADIDSKSTFALLGQLYALQSKQDPTSRPVLTLPIGS